MAPPPEPRPDLFPAPLLRVSTPVDLEQLPTKPQPLLRISLPDDLEQLPPKPHELPMNPEEVQAIFSPAEEHSSNNKPEEQSDEDEVATMEETGSQFSSYEWQPWKKPTVSFLRMRHGTNNMRIHTTVLRQYQRWLKYLTG